MPLRSSGCQNCRKRKIRCDEARPACQRCKTHGVVCLGYRTNKAGGIEFKDQTDVTVLRVTNEQRSGANLKPAPRKNSDDRRSSASSGLAAPTSSHCSLSPASPIQVTYPDHELNAVALSDTLAKRYPYITTPSDYPSPAYTPVPQLTPNLTSLFSPGVERTRLYQGFIDTYIPINSGPAITEGHYVFFRSLANLQSPQPALLHGFDALSLVQLGSVHKDQKLLKQATRQYGRALRALGASIAKGDFLHNDEVLAAVAVLAACELYDEMQDQGSGWQSHVQGANQLVAARGPDSLQSDLSLLLYANMRHGSMCHALIARKAPFMASQEWRNVAFRVPLKKDQSVFFYDWAIQVPGLLERHDNLDLGCEGVLEEIDDLLVECREMERELKKWFAGWQAVSAIDHGPVCELAPIADFPTFLSLCPDDAFDQAFMFPDFLIGYLQTMYWMTIFELRTAIQSLHKYRHRLLTDWYPDPAEEVAECELFAYVLNLCKSIPYFCEPSCNSSGSIGIFLPLRTAAMYLTAHGHWRLLKWLGCVKNNVFVKGLRPPNAGRPAGTPSKPSSPK